MPLHSLAIVIKFAVCQKEWLMINQWSWPRVVDLSFKVIFYSKIFMWNAMIILLFFKLFKDLKWLVFKKQALNDHLISSSQEEITYY